MVVVIDSEGDGIPNFIDEDADGNGIPNSEEIGLDPDNPIDTDRDGIPDYLDVDDDGDGLLDIYDNDRLVPVEASDFHLRSLRNSTRSIYDVAVPGDTIEIICRSNDKTAMTDASKAWVVLHGARRKALVNLQPEGINSDGNLYFNWPDKFESGNVEVFLIYDYKRTIATLIKNTLPHEPIIHSAKQSGDNAVIVGANLSRNFEIVFEGTSQSYDNSSGRNDTFSCPIPKDAESGRLFLRSAAGDSNPVAFFRAPEIREMSGTIDMPKFSERFSNLRISGAAGEETATLNSAGVINNIRTVKGKTGIVSVFYVENGESYLCGSVNVLSSDTSVTINMDNIVLSMLIPNEDVMNLTPSQKASILALPAVQALKNYVENGLTADPKFYDNGSIFDKEPFNGRLFAAMRDMGNYLESTRTPSSIK